MSDSSFDWKNPNEIIYDDKNGQAVYLFGQWQFFAVTDDGVPLKKRCSSLDNAHAEVAAYEAKIKEFDSYSFRTLQEEESFLKEINSLLLDAEILYGIPDDFYVYLIFDEYGNKEYILLKPNRTLNNKSYRNVSRIKDFISRTKLDPDVTCSKPRI